MRGASALQFLGPDRLRVEQGPISLLIEATWSSGAQPSILEQGGLRALQILNELAEEGRVLSVDAQRIRNPVALSSVARRMWEVTLPYHDRFLTPLIAVAGSVADAVADFLVEAGANRVVVNNGGDVALRLGRDAEVSVGVIERLGQAPKAKFEVRHGDDIGGLATSGLGGRSFTLGVADAVTAIGATAAEADVAATLLANEVDVDSPAVERVLAEEIYPDTDLRGVLVTRSKGRLSAQEAGAALDRGAAAARDFLARGLIRGALLFCQGQRRHIGFPEPERLAF